jgi:hypothetical protein
LSISRGMPALDGMVDRIRRIAVEGISHPDDTSLLHAYIACLSFSDLCFAITAMLAEPASVRLALRRTLLRLLREADVQQSDRHQLQDLIERSRAAARENAAVRPFVEALLSAAFEFLAPPQQQSIIEAWIDRGTSGAAARWLKAVAQTTALFDETVVMAYFRSSGSARAVKSLAYQASPAFLRIVIPELLDRCDEGWIVSRAAMRAQEIDDVVWRTIRSKHPATYLYLCARLRRTISEAEALEVVVLCPNSPLNPMRGLAIWAVGQMGMIDVLDRIVDLSEELQERDAEEIRRFIGEP